MCKILLENVATLLDPVKYHQLILIYPVIVVDNRKEEDEKAAELKFLLLDIDF